MDGVDAGAEASTGPSSPNDVLPMHIEAEAVPPVPPDGHPQFEVLVLPPARRGVDADDSAPCECPPPLVRSVETGECELPELPADEYRSRQPPPRIDPVVAADPSAIGSRPKFKVSVPPEDDGDLLTAIAEFASRLEAKASEARQCMEGSGSGAPTGRDCEDDVVAVVAEHSDDGGSSRKSVSESGEEGRTVTAAEAAHLSKSVKAVTVNDAPNDLGRNVGSGGRVVSLEEAVRLTGHGRFHYMLLLVSGVLVMAAVLETVVVGYLLPSATIDLGMTAADKGLLGAASYAGIVLSSHTWGLVADTLGRKTALLWATLLDVVASLASSIAPDFATLTALRFVCGLFTSAPAALSFAYLGEFHTPSTRSRAIIWIGAFPSIGLIILPGVAWAVLPQCWFVDLGFVRFGPWRLLLVLCALISLVSGLALALGLPESPKFLATRDPKKALDILRAMYALNTGNDPDSYPVDVLQDSTTRPSVSTIELGTKTKMSSKYERPSPSSSSLSLRRSLGVVWQQTAPLFRPPFLLHTTLVCILQFGNLASANGLQIWLPDIFNKLAQFEEAFPDERASICASQSAFHTLSANLTLVGDALVEADDDAYVCAEVNVAVFKNNLIIGFASLLMPLMCGLIVNRVGKRNLLVVCLLVSGTFGVLLSVVASSTLVLALSSVSVAINSMGIGHISSIVVELFPTHVRAMAVSLHLMAGRVGSIVGNLIFGALLTTQCPFAFYAIGGALLTCAVFSCFLPARGKYAS